MIPFFWATGGGFLARTLDDPFSPGSNLATSAGWAAVFATRTGQGLLWGTAVRTASIAGTGFGAISGATVTGVILGAGVGAVVGATIGTAISSAIWGEQGKQTAIEFYTGQSGAKWFEYIPQYNAGRIVKHYVVG